MKLYGAISKMKFVVGIPAITASLRITSIIWIGGFYQEPINPDYEELSDLVLSLCADNFLHRQALNEFSFIGNLSHEKIYPILAQGRTPYSY